jgi:hypothetical protein
MNYSRRQLEAFGEPLGESATRLKPGGRIYGGGGGGGGGTSTQVVDLPEWARGYAQDVLKQGSLVTDINKNPYQAYDKPGQERIAKFGELQDTAMGAAKTMGPASQLGTATDLAGDVGTRAMGTKYQAGQFANQFQAPGAYQPGQFSMMQAQAPSLQQYQMDPAERVRTQSFARPGSAEAFMSPYMQNVVDIQQREAQRQADIARTGRGAQAVGAGAFGGSRQAIMEAEAARNLATQKGDIQAQGLQSAYGQAQQQFNAEQQARLQAQLANQQAGLTVGGQNLGARLGVQQLGAGQNLQSQLANQQAFQQAQNAAEQSRQFGAGQGLQAAGMGAQYGQAAQQLGEQSRQYGAGLGMQGLQAGLQAAGQLGQLGGQQFQQGMDVNKLQSAYGGMEQSLRQRDLDQKYQDFLNQQNYPYKQLGFMSDLLRGTPTGSSKTVYEPAGSGLQDLTGLGMGMYGLSKFMAEGGEVKTYAGDQGSVTSEGNVESIIDKLGPEQLQQARENALDRRDMDTVAAIDERMAELAQSKSLTAGLGSAFDQIPAEQQEAMMAGGGIVAMAGGGSYRQKTDEALKGLTDLAGSYKPQTAEQYQAGVEKQMPFVEKLYGPDITAGYLEEVKAERANLGKNTDEAKGLGALLAAAEMIGAKNFREGASKSVKAFTGEVARVAKETKEAKDRLRQSEITLATAQQARKEGLVGKATALEDKAEQQRLKGVELEIGTKEKTATLLAGLEQTGMQTGATLAAAKLNRDAGATADRQIAALAAEIKEKNPNLSPAEINARATKDYLNLSGRFSGAEKLDLARDAENVKFQARVDKALETNMPYLKAVQKGNTAEAARIRQGVTAELSNTAPAAAPAAPQAAATAPVKVTSQEQFAKLPKGTTFVAPDGSIRIKP